VVGQKADNASAVRVEDLALNQKVSAGLLKVMVQAGGEGLEARAGHQAAVRNQIAERGGEAFNLHGLEANALIEKDAAERTRVSEPEVRIFPRRPKKAGLGRDLIFGGLSGGDGRGVNVLGIMKTIVSDARAQPQRVECLPVVIGIKAEAVEAGIDILRNQD